jgi:hypothetical protein
MSNPVYLLGDAAVVCAKHMRDERARNESTYAKKSDVPSQVNLSQTSVTDLLPPL